MVAFDEMSEQPRSASGRGPVFVDTSGRRLRRIKLLGLGALGLVAGYVILLVVALIGGPNVAAPYLPLPAAPAGPPAQAAAHDLPSIPPAGAADTAGLPDGLQRSAETALPAASPAPVTPPSTAPAVVRANDVAAERAADSAAVAAPEPGTEPTAPGKSSTASGQVAQQKPQP
jgi:hypothetical protein